MANRERSTRLTGKYTSVEAMVRATSDDPGFADDFERRSARRRLIRLLISLRGRMGLSQTDLAKRIGCTQSRVSKLEGSEDDEITFGDFRKYAAALGFSMQTSLMPKGVKTVDRVRFHALQIKNLVEKMAGLAEQDPAIAQGVSAFFGEAAFNLLLILQDAADKLPKPADASDDEDDLLFAPEERSEAPPSPPRLVPKRRAGKSKTAVV